MAINLNSGLFDYSKTTIKQEANMQFFFGWIAGVLTCGIWFIVWWLENNGLPGQDDVEVGGG